MRVINLSDAKAGFSKIIADIRSGRESEIVIALAGTPVATITAYAGAPRRVLGQDVGLFTVPDDFDDPDAEIERLFGGENGLP